MVKEEISFVAAWYCEVLIVTMKENISREAKYYSGVCLLSPSKKQFKRNCERYITSVLFFTIFM